MSVFLTDQTLTLNTVATVSLGNYPANNVGWVVLLNHSPFALQATVGQFAVNVPAWYFYPVHVAGKLTGGISVTPYLQAIPGSSFTKTLSTILYDLYEQPDSLQPTALGGGPTDMTTATNISQTGQAGGNNVVFAEPVGDNSVIGAVNINNLGQMTLGDLTNRGALTIEGLSTDPNINLSITGGIRITDASGNLRIDIEQGFIKIDKSGSTIVDLEDTGSSTFANTLIAGGGVNVNTIRDDVTGASQITLTTAGISILNPLQAALQLIAGSISRLVTVGQTSIANAGTSVAHSLGAVPSAVLPILDAGAANTSVITVDYGSFTSSHFTAYTSAAGGTGNVRFLVYGA